MEITAIASGSNGNCCLVEEKDCSVLIDAGKSGREIQSRLCSVGRSMEDIDAILISHCHHDHIAGAGVLSRRFNIPIYINSQTLEECNGKLGNAEIKQFNHNRSFRINRFEVRPVLTSHNVNSCGFMIKDFGLFTDTGCVTKEIETAISKLKCVLLESNHDIDMVLNGPYPYFLKNWILSESGHLSNVHAGQLVQDKGKRLSHVLLGHLSGNNNTPEKAKECFETLVKRKIDFDVCSREKCGKTWSV
ncbi:MBL fold metallo-hydrolase [Candidatus Woesearchaeota archaeon]|nr:MBL fold metallo-hydrolase [Candidatus Woesearchaeota archaeon]